MATQSTASMGNKFNLIKQSTQPNLVLTSRIFHSNAIIRIIRRSHTTLHKQRRQAYLRQLLKTNKYSISLQNHLQHKITSTKHKIQNPFNIWQQSTILRQLKTKKKEILTMNFTYKAVSYCFGGFPFLWNCIDSERVSPQTCSR